MYIPPWAFFKQPEDEQVNIFYLDKDPKIAAKYHCDKHVVKMILETAQVLSAVHHRYHMPAPYKETHKNHPSVLWAGETWNNYAWLWRLGMELCKEYTRRYKKKHKCQWLLENDLRLPPPGIPIDEPFTDPPMCMPDEYKTFDDTVEAYKNYYRGAKAYMAVWKYSDKPTFMEN